MAEFKPSELTLNEDGKLYHLNIGNGDIANTIILVGDQARVEVVGSFFEEITYQTQHREFATITGKYNGKEISVISHGIGCDNMDIVRTEIDAAVNINLKKREINQALKTLNLIRIGTCGALHPDIEVGECIISKYAVGMDGVANFYQIPQSKNVSDGEAAFKKITNWPDDLVIPYFAESDGDLVNLLGDLGEEGITVTANGFYGPQGRGIRLKLKHDDFKERVRLFEWEGHRVTNLEMETSALLALSKGLGHKATTICLVLANRYNNTFVSDFEVKMNALIQKVLDKTIQI